MSPENGGPLQKTTVNPIGKPSFFRGDTTPFLSRPDTTLREQLSSAKAVADAPGAAKLSKMIGG